MDLLWAPGAVLGVADPRRLAWRLEERLGTKDDLGTGGEHHEDPLQASCEDNDASQLPRQVIRPLQAEVPEGRSTRVSLACTTLLRHCRRLGLGWRGAPAPAYADTATVHGHVLHLVQQTMLSVLKLRGRCDEPKVFRERPWHLPRSRPPLLARLLWHVNAGAPIWPGEVKHPQVHDKMRKEGQQRQAPSDGFLCLRIIVAILKTASSHRKVGCHGSEQLRVWQPVMAVAQNVQSQDEGLCRQEDHGHRPHHPEATQLRNRRANSVVGDSVEE
mmetsp:Transcript_109723/g.283566  ORF Transcript_109723/g.283566 Transcript_109723/m.283566 type:complete len:273 (+) Transcript_109723:1350-2168(+)